MAKEKQNIKADIKESAFSISLKEFLKKETAELKPDDGKTLFLLATDDESHSCIGTIQGKRMSVVTSLYTLMKANVMMEEVIKCSVLTFLTGQPHTTETASEGCESDISFHTFNINESKDIGFISIPSEEVESDYLKNIQKFAESHLQDVAEDESKSILLVALDNDSHTILNVVLGKGWNIYSALTGALIESKDYEKAIMLTSGFFCEGPSAFDNYGNLIK